MRPRAIVTLIIVLIVLAAAGVSIWILRQPIRATFTALHRELPAVGPTVRFAVVGDNHGDNPVYRQILQELRAERLDFLLNLADTSEHGTRDEFMAIKALESALSIPVYHAVGNHDIKTDASRRLFSEVFQQNNWASFDHGDVHLVVLDNADRKVGFPDDSLAWLADDLTAHADKQIILAYHRPFDLPLGQVFGDDETTASRATNLRFKEIIATAPVKQIFTGHVHTYLPYTVAGIPAVVTGGGGDPAQTVLGGPSNNLFHYLLVTVAGESVSIDVRRVQLRDTD